MESIGERSGGVPGNQVRKVIARGPVAVGAMRLELFRDFPIRRITVARDDDVRFATR